MLPIFSGHVIATCLIFSLPGFAVFEGDASMLSSAVLLFMIPASWRAWLKISTMGRLSGSVFPYPHDW